MAEFHRGAGGGRFGGFKKGPGQRGPIKRIAPRLAGAAAVAPTAYTLVGSAGAYALSGVAATLSVSRKLAGSAGSYAISGQAAVVQFARKVSGAAGSYAIAGQSASFAVVRRLSGAAGAYSVSGQPASFGVSRKLSGSAGSYSVAGQSATFALARKLSGAAGAYAVAGNSAAFGVQRQLAASPGAYSYAGQATTLAYTSGSSGATAYTLAAAPGGYLLAGSSASFTLSQTTKLGGGSWDKDKKRTWYVQKGKKLYSFDSEEDALLVLNAPDMPKVQTPTHAVVKRAIAKAKTTQIPALVVVQESMPSAQMLAQSQYEALMASIRRWQDEDEQDVEMLLLA